MKESHPTLHIEGNESYRHQIFQKLINDEYLRFNEHNDNRYWITLEGVIFSQKGGYTELKRKETSKRKIRVMEAIALAGGTAAAGLYAIFQFCQWFFDNNHLVLRVEQVTILFVFAFGLLLGLIVMILINLQRSRSASK